MRHNAAEVLNTEKPVQYGIQHESGAWYNYRVGPHVKEVELAMPWEDKTVAEETAAMLTRSAGRGRYTVVPLPEPISRAATSSDLARRKRGQYG